MTSMDYELDTSGLTIQIGPVKVLKPFYRILEVLSKGGYGSVFLAEDYGQREYAVKVQKVFYKTPMLKHERTILDRLYAAEPKGFPKVFDYLQLEGHEFLVMQRMGCSLKDLLEMAPSSGLPKRTALLFGIQAVKRLQTVHKNHILHRDVKPGNFVIGSYGRERTIYLIDFGLAMIVDNWWTYNPDEPCEFNGTIVYAATEALQKKNPTRAGDLESLLYTLIKLFTGELPFPSQPTKNLMHDTVCEQIVQRKQKSVEDICLKCPDLTHFARLILAIKRRQEPNYDELVMELERVLRENGYKNDCIMLG